MLAGNLRSQASRRRLAAGKQSLASSAKPKGGDRCSAELASFSTRCELSVNYQTRRSFGPGRLDLLHQKKRCGSQTSSRETSCELSLHHLIVLTPFDHLVYITVSCICTGRHPAMLSLPSLFQASALVLALAASLSHGASTDMVGTWSTGSGAVLTGSVSNVLTHRRTNRRATMARTVRKGPLRLWKVELEMHWSAGARSRA